MMADLEIYAIEKKRIEGSWDRYYGHIYNVAKVAKKIADKIGLDGEKIYIMGLLHDIGKFDDKLVNRFHGIIGYERLKDEDEEIAKICLLHMFPNNVIRPFEDIGDRVFFNKKKDYDFTVQYAKKNPPNDYDLLIQLADTICHFDRLLTIEERVREYRARHNFKEDESQTQKAIALRMKLKKHFDKKLGVDVYKFLGIKNTMENNF